MPCGDPHVPLHGSACGRLSCTWHVDTVPNPVVDAILENLIEPKRTERPAAHELAAHLVTKCAKQLHSSIHKLLQGSLPTTISTNGDESELRDEWRDLLVELVVLAPDTVSYVLPQLEGVVTMEDEQTRLDGTHLLGRLLSLQEADVASLVPTIFDVAFLGRLKDIAPAVRATAIDIAVPLVHAKPNLASRLITAIEERVLDANDKVREGVVRAVCESSLDNFDAYAPLIAKVRNGRARTDANPPTPCRPSPCSAVRPAVRGGVTDVPATA